VLFQLPKAVTRWQKDRALVDEGLQRLHTRLKDCVEKKRKAEEAKNGGGILELTIIYYSNFA
jgi:hypothetical protein